MAGREYVLTDDDVREAVDEWTWARRISRPELNGSDGRTSDRWLAAHDAAVRVDERERCARRIDSALSEVVIVGAAKGASWGAVTVQISRLLAEIAAAIRTQPEEAEHG